MRRELFRRTILENKWIPRNHKLGLSEKQIRFLSLECREALYGGAAGGGKSDALLMAALQFVDVPGYNAILFRRTLEDHLLPEGLIPRSLEWLGGSEATWNGSHYRWTFPSNATLTFGYLKEEADKYRYQSAAFQFIGWDELTHFLESQYRYLISRLRRLKNFYVPLHVRAATNPGNVGHKWVRKRFITDGPREGRVFIPATLEDNLNLDRASYEKNLALLDPVTYKQLRHGDWDAVQLGSFEFRELIHVFQTLPKREGFNQVIYGVDRGWTNPACTLAIGFDGDGRASVVEEYYQSRQSLETQIQASKEMMLRWGYGPLVCDRSAPADIEEFKKAGLPAEADESKREEGIDELASRFRVAGDGLPRIRIYRGCVNTIREAHVYERKVKENDHAMDAARYAMMKARGSGQLVWVGLA